MKYSVRCGKGEIQVEIPPEVEVSVCRGRYPPHIIHVEQAVEESLSNPIESPPFEEIFSRKKEVVIVVNDHTRPVPNEFILVPILARLHRLGLGPERIRILIATGGHRPSTREEMVYFLGKKAAENYTIWMHDAWNAEQHTTVGKFPNGAQIRIDRRYVESEGKITIGLIEPHLMAGFSGGRKIICPGLADISTLHTIHSAEILDHPLSAPGILNGNPVHQYSTLAQQLAGCDFSVSVVLDDQRRLLKVFSGHPEFSFLQGCRFVEECATSFVPDYADVAITSSAGYPLDTTFYQAIKGIVAPLPVIRQGGMICLVASLSEGLGSPHFIKIYEEVESIQDFYHQITREGKFWKDQWQVQEQVKAAKKARIFVYSPYLPARQLLKVFTFPLKDVHEIIRFYQNNISRSFHLALLPDGPYVLPRVKE
ncbi:MAG: nickel-dependent lactate racemase family protein [bacterium JZ-2024 1]